MAVRGILFDKDGTLVDFHATWMPAYERAAALVSARSPRAVPARELLVASGLDEAGGRCRPGSPLACETNLDIARVWVREAGLGADSPVIDEVLAVLGEASVRDMVAVTDLPALFSRLRARGLRLGIATMDSEAGARAMSARLGVDGLLDFLCGCDSGHGCKPDPGMFRGFCATVGLAPEQVVMVGDTSHDLEMGRRGGAGLVVGVLTGASTRKMLEPLADVVIESLATLEALLDGRP